MADMMTFPETWEEFEQSYGFVDGEKIYMNGSRLIQSFRVKQWLDHIAHLGNKQQATVSSDCVSRQDAKDVVDMELDAIDHVPEWVYDRLLTALDQVPSAQPERKKGKWDFMGWQMFQCSECKHTFTQEFLEGWSEYTYESLFPPFCPNCGSYNGGEQDGSNHTGN